MFSGFPISGGSFPLPVRFLVLPRFPFRVPFRAPLRIPDSGFCIHVGCPNGSVSRSGVGFGTRRSPTQGQLDRVAKDGWWRRQGVGVLVNHKMHRSVSTVYQPAKTWKTPQRKNAKLNGSELDTGTQNGRHERNRKSKWRSETEAKTEDPGEAEDRTETKREQKRKMIDALFPKWALQLYCLIHHFPSSCTLS